MWMTRSRSVVVGALLAIAGTLGAGSAQAAVYRGSWDPAFGAPLPNLGWSATGLFDIDPACLSQATGSYSIPGSCGVTVQSFDVTFYALDDPSQSETFSILSELGSNFLTGIQVFGGQPTGLRSNYTSAFAPSSALLAAGGGAYNFYLDLSYSGKTPVDGNGVLAELGLTPIGGDYSNSCFRDPATPECVLSPNKSFSVLTPVPEPGTFALVFAGLGVLGFTVRRRRR